MKNPTNMKDVTASRLIRLPRKCSLLFLPALLIACGSESSGGSGCDPNKAGTICTVVGEGTRGFGGDNGPAVEAYLDTPQDMVVTPKGELWLIDFNNYVVRAVDTKGTIRTIVGSGLLGDSPPPDEKQVPAIEGNFNHTTDLFLQGNYLYLAAWHNSRVKRVDLSNMMLENYAGIGRRMLYTGDGGPALEAALDLPSGIATDPDGNITIMDQANQVVRKVDHEGDIHCVAGSCVIETPDSPCAPGQVPTPCPDSDKTTCGDPAQTCSEPCTPGYGGDGLPALQARLNQPFGQMAEPAGRIAYDPSGNLILADTGNNRIRKVDTNGIITTIAGTGDAGYSGDNGPAVDAELRDPIDVEVANDGTVYFTDTFNNCVRKIDPGGIISTVVGRCGTDPADHGFGGDGASPTDALLERPYGIEIDGNRLYVADSYNNRIRVVNF